MPKELIYKVTATIKAGEEVFPKGKTYRDSELPQALRDELAYDSGLVEVISFGDDLDDEVTLPEEFDIPPAKKPVSTKKIVKKKKV